MDIHNIKELKETIHEFNDVLSEIRDEDEAYDGEIDELMAAIRRVKEQLKGIDTPEQLKSLMGDFSWDFFRFMVAIQELSELEDEFDYEDEDEFVRLDF